MKRTAFLMLGAALASWGLVVACSDDGGSTFNENPGNTLDDGGPLFGDASVIDGGPVVCNSALSTTFAPTFVPPATVSGACTTEALGLYYDTCLGGSATTACTAWREQNPACSACVDPDGGAGPIQVYGGKYSIPNLGGCIALTVGTEEDAGACAVAQAAANECQLAACGQCIATEGVAGNAIESCRQQAVNQGCSRYASGATTACADGTLGPDGGARACVAAAGEGAGSKTRIVRLMNLFCGSPSVH